VLKGQRIGQADGYVSAAVHAPTSGVVTAVDQQPVPHPSGLPDWCVTIETDGEDRWIEREPVDYRQLHPSDLRNLRAQRRSGRAWVARYFPARSS
jgi:electron transport complex protein RnfC